jgi:hypothetical protein
MQTYFGANALTRAQTGSDGLNFTGPHRSRTGADETFYYIRVGRLPTELQLLISRAGAAHDVSILEHKRYVVVLVAQKSSRGN